MTRKRILLLYAGFLSLLLVSTYIVLRETGVSQAFVENVLARFLKRDRFRLQTANLDLGEGTVTIEGLEVRGSDQAGAAFAVDSVEVGVSTNPLGEVGTVQRIRVAGLHLALDLSEGRAPDLSEFLLQSSEPDEPTADTPFPPIQIADSTITLRISPDGTSAQFTDVNLELIPEEPESDHLVLTGTMTAPNGLRVRVSGGGDLSRPDFRGLLEMVDIPLEPDVVAPYSTELVEYFESISIAGHASKLAVWVEYRGAGADTDEEVTAGVNLQVRDASCRVPQVPYPLVGANAWVSAHTRDNGTIRFRLDNKSVDGDLEVRGSLSNVFDGEPICDVQIEADEVLVGPALRNALSEIEVTRRIWEAFDLAGGRFDTNVYLRNVAPGAPLRAAMDLTLDGVGGRFVGFEGSSGSRVGFPLSLSDVSGRLQLRQGKVHVHGITGVSEAGPIAVRGTVTTQGGREDVDLHIESAQMRFCDSIRSALAALKPGLDQTYDEYSPIGETGLDVEVRFGPTAEEEGAFVRLTPLGCSATYAGFPYRIDDIRGTVDIEPAAVMFELQGNREQSRIAVIGRFASSADASFERMDSELWVRADECVLRSDLIEALDSLSPRIRETLDFLGADFTAAGCEVSLWRDSQNDEFSYDIRIDLTNASAQLENLRLPITGLRGPVFIHGTGEQRRVDVSSVRGQIANHSGEEPASVLVHGTVEIDNDRYGMDVTSVVRQLQLTDELGAALDANGTFELETWNVLKLSGFVDAISRQTHGIDETGIEHRLRLQLRDVNAAAAILPAPARNLNGEVVVESGAARFQDIRGEMADAQIACTNGYAGHEETASVFVVTVSSSDFPVDDRLGNIMSGPLQKRYLEREARGRVKIDRLDLAFEFPDGTTTFETKVAGRFVARDVRMLLGPQLEDLDGAWRIDDGWISSTGGWMRGRVDNGAMTIRGHRASGISASFEADTDRITFSDSRGRLHNGHLFGIARDDGTDLRYEFIDEGRLSFQMGWRDVSLSRLLSASGVEGDFYRGNLAGRFVLDDLNGANFIDAKGSGTCSISEGRLGEVPVFTAIYSHLSPRQRPRFDSARLDVTVDERRIRVESIKLISPLLSAEGSGWIGMDGYIRMLIDFPDFFGNAADWLVLPSVLRLITSSVVRFEIYGFLRNPQAQPRWLFQGDPSRLPIGPIPAHRPRKRHAGG